MLRYPSISPIKTRDSSTMKPGGGSIVFLVIATALLVVRMGK